MINGVINVYKEAGFTSHDVVAKLRGIAGQRKIGHTGTLDPDAVGVLPVCLGNATKLCDMLTDETKEYEACLQLGITTDTQDLSGQVLTTSPVLLNEEEFQRAALSFVGSYDQIPPMYSALKVGGKKLYELAREGKTVERKPRRVEIFSLEILDIQLPLATIRVTCSKGTYIRTLCQDIGERLGCGGAMRSLKRTRVGTFQIENAYTLKALQERKDAGELLTAVTPVDALFETLPAFRVKKEALRLVRNGNSIPRSMVEQAEAGTKEPGNGQQIRVYDADRRFYGIYRYEERTGLVKPVRMFLEREE